MFGLLTWVVACSPQSDSVGDQRDISDSGRTINIDTPTTPEYYATNPREGGIWEGCATLHDVEVFGGPGYQWASQWLPLDDGGRILSIQDEGQATLDGSDWRGNKIAKAWSVQWFQDSKGNTRKIDALPMPTDGYLALDTRAVSQDGSTLLEGWFGGTMVFDEGLPTEAMIGPTDGLAHAVVRQAPDGTVDWVRLFDESPLFGLEPWPGGGHLQVVRTLSTDQGQGNLLRRYEVQRVAHDGSVQWTRQLTGLSQWMREEEVVVDPSGEHVTMVLSFEDDEKDGTLQINVGQPDEVSLNALSTMTALIRWDKNGDFTWLQRIVGDELRPNSVTAASSIGNGGIALAGLLEGPTTFGPGSASEFTAGENITDGFANPEAWMATLDADGRLDTFLRTRLGVEDNADSAAKSTQILGLSNGDALWVGQMNGAVELGAGTRSPVRFDGGPSTFIARVSGDQVACATLVAQGEEADVFPFSLGELDDGRIFMLVSVDTPLTFGQGEGSVVVVPEGQDGVGLTVSLTGAPTSP